MGNNPVLKPPLWRLCLMELRAPFLLASFIPVLVGTALAFHDIGIWNWPRFILAASAIMLIHAGANVANDYFDHLNGNDAANTEFVRPFTGGSRMIQNGLMLPGQVLTLSVICLLFGGNLGLFLVVLTGWPVLLLAAAGIAGGVWYSAPPLKLASRGLGELVIALNFGILPVLGAYYVQTGRFDVRALLFGVPLGVMVAAIVFINQFQDYAADKAVGKRNWVVRLGRKRSAGVYRVMMLAWPVALIFAALRTDGSIRFFLPALLPAIIGSLASARVRRDFDRPVCLVPANAMTIIVHHLAGVLIAGALIARRLMAGG